MTDESAQLGVWQLQSRRITLMIGHALAVALDWDSADLTALFKYRVWVMSKALEAKDGSRPAVKNVMAADYEVRAQWMLS